MYALEIANTKRGQIEKFIYRLDLAIAKDVTIEAQPPQTYSKVRAKH